MLKVISKFKQLNISLTPAGRWEFLTAGKRPIDPLRTYTAQWEQHPSDNMAKFDIGATDYVVIDIDGGDYREVEELLPSIKGSFYTITTKAYKKHIYMLPPEGVEKSLFRYIKWRDIDVDILSTGTLFEGHGRELNTTRQGVVYSMNGETVKRFTAEEWELLEGGNGKKKTTNSYQGDKPLFYNLPMRNIGLKLLRSDDKGKPKRLTPKEYNSFFFSLGLLNEKSRERKPLKPLSYDSFNRAVSMLYFNSALDTKDSEKIAVAILRDYYGMNPNSEQSQKRLYGQILPNLPRHQSVLNMSSENDIEKRLKLIARGDKTFIKFVDGRGAIQYIVLDVNSLEVVRVSAEAVSITQRALGSIVGMGGNVLAEWVEHIPLVRLIDSPFKPTLFFDVEVHMDTYNISRKTRYQKEAVADSRPPDNVLMRVIESYMGRYTSLYLAWLAEVVFGDTPPNTILLLVSSPDTKAGTGKTTLASSLPQNLCYTATGITEADVAGGWGDFFIGKSLVSINDARNATLWKDTIYPTMRDETTGGLRRQRNKKYGGIIEGSDSVAFSLSANYIPPLDPHDRRCLVIEPQFLLGESKELSLEDSTLLNKLIEQSSLDNFKAEFLALAHHLKWWYGEKRYRHELRVEAPHTKTRDTAVSEGKGYGRQIVPLIQRRLDELYLYLPPKSYHRDYPLNSETVKQYLAFVIHESGGRVDSIYLPTEFFGNLLSLIQRSPKTTTATIVNGLGLTLTTVEELDKVPNWSKDKAQTMRIPLTVLNWGKRGIRLKIIEQEPLRELLHLANMELGTRILPKTGK